jgi:transcriptional regulator with XRE-family HTH domain
MSAARKNIVGLTVREKRRALGIDQDELAARLGRIGWETSENVLSKIEAGYRRVSDEEIVFLARALRVNIGDLFPASRLDAFRIRRRPR